MPRGADEVPAGTADASLPDEAKPSRLRADAEQAGFLQFFRDYKAVFGDGVRIVYCSNGKDSYGTPQPRGVPLSDPPPKPLTRKGKR